MPPVGLRALIDGDILVYRCAAACEQKEYTFLWKEDITAQAPQKFRYIKDAKLALKDKYKEYIREEKPIVSPPEHCLHSIKHTLEKIVRETHAGSISIYLGGKDNFRDRVDPDYKAGRGPKPTHYQTARDYLTTFFDAIIVDGQEVDDKLAQEQSGSTVICSIDKDLYQVPGAHYNWVTDSWKHVTEQEGNEWFWIQMLVGDKVDNIIGIDGVGIVSAVQLIEMFEGNLSQARSFVQGVYLYEKGSIKQYLINARLLYIRRSTDHVSAARIFMECV